MLKGSLSAQDAAAFAASRVDRNEHPVSAAHYRRLGGAPVSSLAMNLEGGEGELELLQAGVEHGTNLFCVPAAVGEEGRRSIARTLQEATSGEELNRPMFGVSAALGLLEAPLPLGPRTQWVTRHILEAGLGTWDDIVSDVRPGRREPFWHCFTTAYFQMQLARLREELGLQTVDVLLFDGLEALFRSRTEAFAEATLGKLCSAAEAACAKGQIGRYGMVLRRPLGLPGAARPGPNPSLETLKKAAVGAGGGAHHLHVLQVPLSVARPAALLGGSAPDPSQGGFLLETAAQHGMFVLAEAPLEGGETFSFDAWEEFPGLGSDVQRSLQFVRSAPGVGAALVDAADTGSLAELLAVGRTPPASPERMLALLPDEEEA